MPFLHVITKLINDPVLTVASSAGRSVPVALGTFQKSQSMTCCTVWLLPEAASDQFCLAVNSRDPLLQVGSCRGDDRTVLAVSRME